MALGDGLLGFYFSMFANSEAENPSNKIISPNDIYILTPKQES